MLKNKTRRWLIVISFIVLGLVYIEYSHDIIDTLETTSIQNQLSDMTIHTTSDKEIPITNDKEIQRKESDNESKENTISLKVKSVEEKNKIFINNTKEDVLEQLGKPTKIETKFLNQWSYGESMIYFDSVDLVVGYLDLGELTYTLPTKNVDFDGYIKPEIFKKSGEFFIGDTKEYILALLGAPTFIDPLRPMTWKYDNSTIHFTSEDIVDGYLNYYNDMNAYLPKQTNNNGLFEKDDTKEKVISIMGAPSSIEYYHPNVWIYKLAKVYFTETNRVDHWDDGYNDLNVIH